MDLSTMGMDFNSTATGIRVNGGLVHGYSIVENDIEAAAQGIFVTAQSGLPTASSISKNTVAVTGAISHGIILMNNKGLATHTSYLYDNTIHLNKGYAGILLSSGARTHLTANNVQINTPAGPKRYGIHLAGGEQNLVNCNDILGAGSRGILGEMAGRTDFLCNTADGPDYGLYLDGVFTGTAPAIFVGDNKLKNNAQAGLLLGSNALIGPQTHRGNRWSNSTGLTLARHLGGSPMANLSIFVVDANENSEYFPAIISPDNWFEDIADPEISFICNLTADCPPPPALTGEGEEVDRHTAKGTLTGFEHQDHSLWLAQKRLYRRLVYEDNPYPNDTDFDDFLGTQIIGSAGQFAAVQQYQSENVETIVFSLYNTFGQLVAIQRLAHSSGNAIIPVGQFSSGIYYYVTSDGRSGKVSIQH